MSWVPAAFTDLGVSASDKRFRNMAVGADGVFYVTTPTKVFRSVDGFANLVDVSPKIPSAGVEEYFGVSVSPSGAVFVTLLRGGIYKSINSGSSWTLVCGAAHIWRSIHAISDSMWLVGTFEAGVVRTVDGGSSFTTVFAGIRSTQCFTVEGDGTVAMVVLGAIDDTPSLEGRIYTTANQGDSWSVKYSAPDTSISGAVCDPYSGAYYVGIYNGTTKATLDFMSFTDVSSDYIHGGVVFADRAYICSYFGQSISRSVPIIGPAPNAPRIYPSTGILQGIQLVVIQGTGVIRYTLDGSEPSASSPIYTAPFRLSSPTIVKARAYSPLGSTTATEVLDIRGAVLQAVPSYQDHVLPYLLEQYKGDNA